MTDAHHTLTTERLILRPWRDDDLAPFAALKADPRVMASLGGVIDRAESNAKVARIRERLAVDGFCFWAVELRGIASFIGAVGLSRPRFTAHFTPCVEVGWRLAFVHWGKGYATEAARAALGHGFERAHLEEIVSFTAATNTRSRAVMERLGMRRDSSDDFDHPELPEDHPLRRHVLYRLRRTDWRGDGR